MTRANPAPTSAMRALTASADPRRMAGSTGQSIPPSPTSRTHHLSLSIERVRLSLPAGVATPAWIDRFSAALPRAIESRLAELMQGSTSSPTSAPRAPISGEQAAAWVADQVASLAADRIAESTAGGSA